MKIWKRRAAGQETAAGLVQLRGGERHPFALLDGYVPLHEPAFGLYRAIREAVPVVDAAVLKLVRLAGGVRVTCADKGLEKRLAEFLRTVPVGWNQVGLQAFLDSYLDCLLTCGKAVGEVVPTRDGRGVAAVLCVMVSSFGAGAAEGAIDAANILKPALSRGEIQIVGATTLSEYRKHIEKDAAFERRFQPVTVAEPTEDESFQILRGLRDRYEAHHGLKITDEALTAAVKLSARYISDRFLPDKAIDLVDEAASRVRMENLTAPDEMKTIEAKLATLSAQKEEAVRAQDYELAAQLRDRERSERGALEKARGEWDAERGGHRGAVSAEDIAAVVSGWTGIPVTSLTESESERLLHMEDVLHRRVIGQNEAVAAVARAIRRGRVGREIANTLTASSDQGTPCFVDINEDPAFTSYARCLTARQSSGFHKHRGEASGVWNGCRIRRLTPKECLRLQGWQDNRIEKVLAIQSDAQLYKQAGNGVTVTVVEAIGKRLSAAHREVTAIH